MEVLAERQEAQEKEEDQVVHRVGREVDRLERGGRQAREQGTECPGQGERGAGVPGQPLRGRCGSQARVEQALAHQQGADEPQHQDGLGRVVLAVALGHRVTRGLEREPPHGQCRGRQEHRRAGVILDDAVKGPERAAEPGQGEAVHEPQDDELGGPGGQRQEAEEDDDVQHPGRQVPRVPPLPEPDPEHRLKAFGDAVEARVGCGLEQRLDAAAHDVDEKADADRGDQHEQELQRDAEPGCSCGRGQGRVHGSPLFTCSG